MDPKILETQLDDMWGKVTLYNVYQLFVQLTSKKIKSPMVKFKDEVNSGKYDGLSDEEYNALKAKAEKDSEFWENRPEMDCLTLFFNATDALPTNSMRRLVSNANNALRAIAGADKMLASVYGIAITAMVRHACG